MTPLHHLLTVCFCALALAAGGLLSCPSASVAAEVKPLLSHSAPLFSVNNDDDGPTCGDSNGDGACDEEGSRD